MLILVLFAVLLLGASDAPTFIRPEPVPQTVELADGWTLISDRDAAGDGAEISSPGYRDTGWHPIRRMPSTVLAALEDAGVYPNLYYGTNLRDEVPPDLYRQDWWYRTTFTAPAGHSRYTLDFPGINYRAEVWLNGQRIADAAQLVGMYVDHQLDITRWLRSDTPNTLAVKITPERSMQDVDGIELADSWWDWINWRDIGHQGPPGDPAVGTSFVPDRNAGIWKPVFLNAGGAAELASATVNTELPLPNLDSARLTVNTAVSNTSEQTLRGAVRAIISRPDAPTVTVEQPVRLAAGEQRAVVFDPMTFAQLTIDEPALWWPYTMGNPELYDLRLEFRQHGRVLDTRTQRFGIRTVTQHRDDSTEFPELGRGGNFYLQVNGRDFPVRGATYTPDLLFRYNPDRERAILSYVRDLGLNLLRLEGKFPGDGLLEQADELGIPLMYGWMCCNQWEKWWQWDDEDRRIAQDSMRSQIATFGPHAAAFIWANGSDGRPPPEVRGWYHDILAEARWQNATVDTVSSVNRDDDGEIVWDGIQMAGPYSWRPPSYWFAGRYAAARGSSAEQGDNEHIPPYASLIKFIPRDKLWPINDVWYLHAGSDDSNVELDSIRTAVMRRYGSSRSAEEFTRKAQLAHYESTRAQFESFAAGGWDSHKMTIYWMLNNHWPSFFGHLFDYYLRPGGSYFGAKKGLRPLSVVFDAYATGDHSTANLTVVNQSPDAAPGMRVRVRVYDLAGELLDDRRSETVDVPANGTAAALTLPEVAAAAPVFFVRAELLDADNRVVTENVYWQSQQRDDVGDPRNDTAFSLKQSSWADMTPLNTMPRAPLRISARKSGEREVIIALSNPSERIAFFERAEVLATRDGDEILPVTYSDNYVTVFPGETVEVRASVPAGTPAPAWVRVTGYNTPPKTAAVAESASGPR